MARVHFASGLARFTDGAAEVDIDAGRVSELVAALEERYPGIGGVIGEMAVAIDGEVHNNPAYKSLGPDSEVHFLPKIGGGC